MGQSDQYSDKEEVAYLANFPGADIENDVVVVRIGEGEVDISSNDDRDLGDVEISGVKEALETTLNEALSSVGNDSVVVSTDEPLDVSGGTVEVEQSSPVKIIPMESLPMVLENTSGDQIDPATQETLNSIAGALQSNDSDKLVVDHPNVIDISSRDGRNLGDVDVESVNNPVQTEDSDSGSFNGAVLAADGNVSITLSGQGADNVRGRVTSDNQYTVQLSWKDSGGNEIFNDEIQAGVAGGETTDIDEVAISPYVDVVVVEGSSAESSVDGVAHLS